MIVMRLRVLVVDDEDSVLKAVRRALFGHDVVTVLSGAAAMAVLESGARFDVAIIDVVMPGMSGEDLARRIAGLAPDLVHRILLLTGDDAALARRSSFGHPVFAKPIDTQRLRSCVEQLIRPTGVRKRADLPPEASAPADEMSERPTLPPAACGGRDERD